MADTNIVLPSKPRIIKEDSRAGVYEIEGLYPGYGHTLGNSLRRIILSSLPGAAITSLKIKGAEHEFSALPGIKEDTLALVLNLKKVCFKLTTDEPKRLRLQASGEKKVTAGDIALDGQVEILNKDLVLANLTEKKAELDVEMTVEKGLGYLPKEIVGQGKNEIGTIFLDAVFTPIRKVSYAVENMRVGDRTDFNRLRIEIETDGSITPHRALEEAIETMINQLKAVVGFKEEVVAVGMMEELPATASAATKEVSSEEVMKTKIEDLALSARIQKSLTEAGVRTIGGLVRRREDDLKEFSGLGAKGIQEIKKVLSNYGLTLKD